MLFGMLKLERVNHRQYRTRDEARADLFDYLERFHNPRMRHGAPRQDRKLSALTQPSVAMGQNPTAAFARELLQEVNADEDGVPLVPRNLVDAVDLGRCSSMPIPSNRRRHQAGPPWREMGVFYSASLVGEKVAKLMTIHSSKRSVSSDRLRTICQSLAA